MRSLRSGLVMAALLTLPAGAYANHNQGSATPQGINARPTAFTLTAAQGEGWFKFSPTAGRSYCVEVTKGEFELGEAEADVVVFGGDGATTIDSRDRTHSEPNLFWGASSCFVVQFNEWHYARVAQVSISAGTTTKYEIRIVDTTLFSPFFQVATSAGYDAAPQIRNNTSASIDAYFTAYNAAGTPLPNCLTTAITIPPNGMTTFGVSARCQTTSAHGSAQIAHTGPPGGLSANITTFSAASGLSFDAAFTPRQDYRH